MRLHQKSLIVAAVVLLLFLISYRYSLYQNQSLLPYLTDPASATSFQKIVTYTFMMVGIPPTMLLILFTTFFCTTSYPNYVVQISCFGNPFSLSDSGGFFAYVVASLVSLAILWYLAATVSRFGQHDKKRS